MYTVANRLQITCSGGFTLSWRAQCVILSLTTLIICLYLHGRICIFTPTFTGRVSRHAPQLFTPKNVKESNMVKDGSCGRLSCPLGDTRTLTYIIRSERTPETFIPAGVHFTEAAHLEHVQQHASIYRETSVIGAWTPNAGFARLASCSLNRAVINCDSLKLSEFGKVWHFK